MTLKPETLEQELNFKVIERAIIYARVSSDEQAATGTSLDNQVTASLEYAQANNINVVAIFREDYPGTVLDRPELNKARQMLRDGLADSLIAYKSNRLDRSQWGVNTLLLMQELRQLGASLHFSETKKKVDLDNPMEVLMYGSFGGWQAGEDHRETVRKLELGRMNRAKEGYIVIAVPPYGYKKIQDEKTKKWFLEIVENEAKIVKLIFQWYVIGDENGKKLSLRAITKKLNELGIKNRENKNWLISAVKYIVKSETYCGVWYYGKKSEKINNPISVEVPPIVSRESWEMAQIQLEKNKQYASRRRKPGCYLLSGHLKCGICGLAMTGLTRIARNKEYSYYACSSRFRGELKTCVKNFRTDIVDSQVWNWITEIAKDKDTLATNLQACQALEQEKLAPIQQELESVIELIEAKEQELNEQMDSLSVLNSKRAKAKISVDIENIEKVLDALEARKTELEAKLQAGKLSEQEITGLSDFINQINHDIQIIELAELEGLKENKLKLQVFEAKRRILDMLDIEVKLFVDEDNKQKAKVTAIFYTKEIVLFIDSIPTCGTNHNRQIEYTVILDVER